MSLLTSRDHALRVAVWSVMTTEAVAFAALVLARPPGLGCVPALPGVLLAMVIGAALAGGSALLAGSLRRACAGQLADAVRGLTAAIVLGLAALILELAASHASGARDPIAMITAGLHAAHVAAAIALATWVRALVQHGRFRRRQFDVLRLVGLYWGFVAVVWVVVWPVFVAARA